MTSIVDSNTQGFARANQQARNEVNHDDGFAGLGATEAAVVGAGSGTAGATAAAATIEGGVVYAIVAATRTVASRIIIVALRAVHAAAHLFSCLQWQQEGREGAKRRVNTKVCQV